MFHRNKLAFLLLLLATPVYAQTITGGNLQTIEQGAWSDAIDSIQVSGSDDGGTTPRRVKTLADGTVTVQAQAANAAPVVACNNNAFLAMTSATTTQIVALSGSTVIYVCSIRIILGGSTATNVKFVAGTGADCVTSQEDRTENWPLDPTSRPGLANGSGLGMLFKTTAADALCVTSSAAGNPLAIGITYAQY